MRKLKQITPMLLAFALIAGTVFIYKPEDAGAMPHPLTDQQSLEQLVHSAEG